MFPEFTKDIELGASDSLNINIFQWAASEFIIME